MSEPEKPKKPKTLEEMIAQIEDLIAEGQPSTPLGDLALATAKAVLDLYQHQHQVIVMPVLGGNPQTEITTRPVGYGSKR